MAKAVKTIVKLQIVAGRANPAPPVGTALGPHGIDMMAFCSQFNERTKEMGDAVVPAEITIYEDRTFDFVTKTSPAVYLIKKAIRLDKGSGVPNKEKVGRISRAQLEAIANEKMQDLNANSLEQAVRIIAGTARSMGVEVEK
jgi:large subunit ribosomal protein L11